MILTHVIADRLVGGIQLIFVAENGQEAASLPEQFAQYVGKNVVVEIREKDEGLRTDR